MLRARLLAPTFALLFLLAAPAALAAPRWTGPGSAYAVSELDVAFALDHPSHFPAEEILDLEVGLHHTPRGYTAPRVTAWSERMILGQLPEDALFFPSALQHINWWIIKALNARGIDGVIVTVPDVEPRTGRDLRPPGETRLRLRIWTGRVADVRTLADGARFDELPPDRATNHPTHEWIREASPVQPGGEQGVLRAAELDEYAIALSRHPGRQVSAELSPGRQPGTTRVHYRVAESRPWTAHVQLSNTGTEQTSEFRQRFGFTHTQLLGRDDILRLDYVTAGFQDVNGVYASYEAPLAMSRPRLRWALGGSWSDYDASEVGFSQARFEGMTWEAGGKLVYNLLQRRRLFVDVEAGARWQHAEVDNAFLLTRAEDDFFLPHLGVRIEHDTPDATLHASATLEGNIGAVAGSDTEDMRLLGRQDPKRNFTLVRWDGSYSFYLEPWIAKRLWRYSSRPWPLERSHELALAFKGQWSFDRLVPQHERAVGGFYSVRGYEQSLLAGDQVAIGSVEYRYHFPRSLEPDPEPLKVPLVGDFHLRRPRPESRPDWDLILRLFVDAAHVGAADAFGYEDEELLASVGGGIELQVFRNLSLRMDTGVALSEVRSVDVGNTEVHLMGTLVY